MRLETFFSIFAKKKKKFPKMNNIFMEKRKKCEKKKIAAARLASILATRCTGNRIFFNGQPKGKVDLYCSVLLYRRGRTASGFISRYNIAGHDPAPG